MHIPSATVEPLKQVPLASQRRHKSCLKRLVHTIGRRSDGDDREDGELRAVYNECTVDDMLTSNLAYIYI